MRAYTCRAYYALDIYILTIILPLCSILINKTEAEILIGGLIFSKLQLFIMKCRVKAQMIQNNYVLTTRYRECLKGNIQRFCLFKRA